jgi:hypothetical protein
VVADIDGTVVGHVGFSLVSTPSVEAFQVLELVPGSMPRDAGLVTYSPESASIE